jgi:hypothetical protein
VLAVLAACGGVPKQRFKFDAIDVAENPRPCLVVVNDDFGQAVADLQAILAGRGDALRGGRRALTPLLADLLADPLAD